jgi:hypothetical protein
LCVRVCACVCVYVCTVGLERDALCSAHACMCLQVYDLFAVVMHSGGPHSGHYHAYIRDMMGEGRWVPAADVILPAPAPKPNRFVLRRRCSCS